MRLSEEISTLYDKICDINKIAKLLRINGFYVSFDILSPEEITNKSIYNASGNKFCPDEVTVRIWKKDAGDKS